MDYNKYFEYFDFKYFEYIYILLSSFD